MGSAVKHFPVELSDELLKRKSDLGLGYSHQRIYERGITAFEEEKAAEFNSVGLKNIRKYRREKRPSQSRAA